MAMGTRRRRQRQEGLWIGHDEIAKGPGHPFYKKVNELLEEAKFDDFAETECAKFYAENNGRPSLTPGIYFRILLLAYFEGIDSERGMAWRAADSLGVRQFLGIGLDQPTPDHSTISRTRRLMDIETHKKVFSWILEVLRERGLIHGKTVGIDATTLEANAAMRSIVRRDTAESYEEFEHVAELLVTEAEKAPEEKPQMYFQGVREVVTDKGYQSGDVLVEIKDMEVRTYIPEKKQTQRRDWDGQKNQAKARAQQEATYANRRRVGGAYGKSLLRKRGELVERSFAHCYETGGMRRTHLRGQKNIFKRLLIHVGAFNLGLLVRTMLGAGKPREWKNRHASASSRGSRLEKRFVFNPTTAGTPKSPLSPLSAAPFERTGFCHGLLVQVAIISELPTTLPNEGYETRQN